MDSDNDPKDFPLYAEEGADTHTLSYLRPIVEHLVDKPDASEVTITFKQSWRDNLTNDEIITMLKRYFRFLPLDNLREILLVPEYGANKNLHFHGIIRGRAKELSTLKGFLNKRFGRTTIQMIKYPASYGKYMMKEQRHTVIEDIIHNHYEEEIERLI